MLAIMPVRMGMSDPDAFLDEVGRVLRPGGTFVGSVPNAYRLKNRILGLFGSSPDDDDTHLHRFSIPDLQALFCPRFSDILIKPIVGKLTALSPRLFANDLAWKCQKI